MYSNHSGESPPGRKSDGDPTEGKPSAMNHQCSQCSTLHTGCTDCPVADSGMAEQFGRVVGRMVANINSKYSRFHDQVREDVIADTIEGCIKGLPNFEGRRGAKLSSWVWEIYQHKLNDMLRRFGKGISIDYDELDRHAPPHREEESRLGDLLEVLGKMAGKAGNGCAELFLRLHECFQHGYSQKELAAEMGMKTNSLNQKIKRCREWMRERLDRHDF